MRMKLIFLAAAAAITMLRVYGDDSAKPLPSPTNGQKPQGALGVGSEKILKNFTEKEFLGHQFAMRPAQPCCPPTAM